MRNELRKTDEQLQYISSILKKPIIGKSLCNEKTNTVNKKDEGIVRLRGHQCSIPDYIIKKLTLKNHQRVIVYRDDNMNFFISKGDEQGFRVKNEKYINPNRILKTGIKIGDYKYIDKCIERGGVLLYVFMLSKKPILKDTIKQIGWDYKGGSNSASVLYPDKKILSVPVSSPACFFSQTASDYLGLTDGRRGLIIQGADKERYLMILDKYSSNVTQGLIIKKYPDRKRFIMSSSKIQKKTIPPAVYEIKKAGEMGGIPYYKLIKIGKALHSNQ